VESRRIGITGTKKKYVQHIIEQGINNPNSALFSLDLRETALFNARMLFTVDVAIYHAISLAVQKKIRQMGITFLDYYSSSPDDLPALIIVKGNTVEEIGLVSPKKYASSSDLCLTTYPYGKIVDYQPIPPQNIMAIVMSTLYDIEEAQNCIDFECFDVRVQTRFFVSLLQRKLPSEIIEKFLPDYIIRPFVVQLRDIVLKRIWNQFAETDKD